MFLDHITGCYTVGLVCCWGCYCLLSLCKTGNLAYWKINQLRVSSLIKAVHIGVVAVFAAAHLNFGGAFFFHQALGL